MRLRHVASFPCFAAAGHSGDSAPLDSASLYCVAATAAVKEGDESFLFFQKRYSPLFCMSTRTGQAFLQFLEFIFIKKRKTNDQTQVSAFVALQFSCSYVLNF